MFVARLTSWKLLGTEISKGLETKNGLTHFKISELKKLSDASKSQQSTSVGNPYCLRYSEVKTERMLRGMRSLNCNTVGISLITVRPSLVAE